MRRIEHPALEITDYQRHYWDQQWSGEDTGKIKRKLRREGILSLAQRVFAPGSLLLEAGCGSGAYCMGLTDVGYRVVGVDFAASGLRFCHETAPSIFLARGSVVDLPFADGTFDGALSLGVVEHFEEGPEAALSALARVVRPGGRLLLTVPFEHLLWQLNDALWPDGWALADGGAKTFYQYLFRKDEIVAHTEAAGFSIREIRYLTKFRGLRDLYPLSGEPRRPRATNGHRAPATRLTPASAGWKQIIKKRLPAVAERLRDAQMALFEALLPGPLCGHSIVLIAEKQGRAA